MMYAKRAKQLTLPQGWVLKHGLPGGPAPHTTLILGVPNFRLTSQHHIFCSNISRLLLTRGIIHLTHERNSQYLSRIMPQINDVEMQYRAAEAMQAQQMPSNAATPQEQREVCTVGLGLRRWVYGTRPLTFNARELPNRR